MLSFQSMLLTYVPFVFILFGLPACIDHVKSPVIQESVAKKKQITISGVGDVMMPLSIQSVAAKRGYNYDILFERIAPDLSAPHITFANLETPIDHTAEISGYPRFNSRRELLSALRRAGVDIVSIANNHVMDMGEAGLIRTIDNISEAGLAFVGAGRTKSEANEIKIISANGITCAFLAYTYGTNERLPGRRATSPGVNILRPDSDADLLKAIEKVKEARTAADIVIVSLHWGDEYSTTPSGWQKEAAYQLINAGADIIFGHHPHVLQPIETISTRDGRHALVAYSLGNFISSQNYGLSFKNRRDPRALRGDGVILNITASKSEDVVAIDRIEFIPIWTLREKEGGLYVARPVNIAAEVRRLEALSNREEDGEDILKLLRYRYKVITETLGPGPSSP